MAKVCGRRASNRSGRRECCSSKAGGGKEKQSGRGGGGKPVPVLPPPPPPAAPPPTTAAAAPAASAAAAAAAVGDDDDDGVEEAEDRGSDREDRAGPRRPHCAIHGPQGPAQQGVHREGPEGPARPPLRPHSHRVLRRAGPAGLRPAQYGGRLADEECQGRNRRARRAPPLAADRRRCCCCGRHGGRSRSGARLRCRRGPARSGQFDELQLGRHRHGVLLPDGCRALFVPARPAVANQQPRPGPPAVARLQPQPVLVRHGLVGSAEHRRDGSWGQRQYRQLVAASAAVGDRPPVLYSEGTPSVQRLAFGSFLDGLDGFRDRPQ
ncbi:uncharacterized protein M6B38_156525 [Iris pallida]|uniref:Uncharacterized protein n=1 Tax=Iris pallida TaxID=29817 RepID=A0AAX6F2S8_IRIPA|nr:uncharacterized protein M6B38_156525 [Iris pallida]